MRSVPPLQPLFNSFFIHLYSLGSEELSVGQGVPLRPAYCEFMTPSLRKALFYPSCRYILLRCLVTAWERRGRDKKGGHVKGAMCPQKDPQKRGGRRGKKARALISFSLALPTNLVPK